MLNYSMLKKVVVTIITAQAGKGGIMLQGKDFVILSEDEITKLYHAIVPFTPNLADYTDLQERGILNLVHEIKDFINREV